MFLLILPGRKPECITASTFDTLFINGYFNREIPPRPDKSPIPVALGDELARFFPHPDTKNIQAIVYVIIRVIRVPMVGHRDS
jgi:hypothetical protein